MRRKAITISKYTIFISFLWLKLICCDGRKPNIVVIYIEQINDILSDVLSPTLGEDLINLNNLRKDSVKFHNVFGEASSTSTFAALLTGKPAVDLGMIRGKVLPFSSFPSLASSGGLSTSENTIAKDLLKKNYKTWFTGFWKMGLGRKGVNYPTEHGFMTWLGVAYQHNEWCQRQRSLFTNQESLLYHPYLKLFYRTSFLWLLLFLFMTVLCWCRFISFQLYMNLLIYTISTGFAFYILLHLFIIQRSASCVLYFDNEVIEQPYDVTNITLRFTQHATNLIEGAAKLNEDPFFMVLNYLKMLPPYIHSSYFDEVRSHTRRNSLLELDWSIGLIIRILKAEKLYDDTIIIFTGGNTCSHSNSEMLTVYQKTSSNSFSEISSEINWNRCFKTTLWLKDVADEKTSISEVRDVVPITGIYHTILHLATHPELSNDESFLRHFRHGTCPTKPFLELSSVAMETFMGDKLLPDNRSSEDSAIQNFFTVGKVEKGRKEWRDVLFHYFNVQRPVMVTYKEEFQIIFYYLDEYNSLQKLKQPLIVDLKGRALTNRSEENIYLENVYNDVMKEMKSHLQERQHSNLWTSQFEMPVLPWLLPCENFPYCRTRNHDDEDYSYLFRIEN